MSDTQIDFVARANFAFDDAVFQYSSQVVSNKDLTGLSKNLKLYSDFVLKMQVKTEDLANEINRDGEFDQEELRKLIVAKMKRNLVEMKALIGL